MSLRFALVIALLLAATACSGAATDAGDAVSEAGDILESADVPTQPEEAISEAAEALESADIPTPAEEAVEEATAAAAELPSDECNAAFAEAAAVDEMQDTVEDLVPAIEACTSIEDWAAASDLNPAALEGTDPETFLTNMCASFDVEGLCAQLGS